MIIQGTLLLSPAGEPQALAADTLDYNGPVVTIQTVADSLVLTPDTLVLSFDRNQAGDPIQWIEAGEVRKGMYLAHTPSPPASWPDRASVTEPHPDMYIRIPPHVSRYIMAQARDHGVDLGRVERRLFKRTVLARHADSGTSSKIRWRSLRAILSAVGVGFEEVWDDTIVEITPRLSLPLRSMFARVGWEMGYIAGLVAGARRLYRVNGSLTIWAPGVYNGSVDEAREVFNTVFPWGRLRLTPSIRYVKMTFLRVPYTWLLYNFSEAFEGLYPLLVARSTLDANKGFITAIHRVSYDGTLATVFSKSLARGIRLVLWRMGVLTRVTSKYSDNLYKYMVKPYSRLDYEKLATWLDGIKDPRKGDPVPVTIRTERILESMGLTPGMIGAVSRGLAGEALARLSRYNSDEDAIREIALAMRYRWARVVRVERRRYNGLVIRIPPHPASPLIVRESA